MASYSMHDVTSTMHQTEFTIVTATVVSAAVTTAVTTTTTTTTTDYCYYYLMALNTIQIPSLFIHVHDLSICKHKSEMWLCTYVLT
jgi:hypothetical protein